ncbi:MAG: hypothetical protein K2P80_06280 [Beijerinckiaceae bacterium]|nr:hypothetical protein [Beijerinckiaceae bacterium]
MPTKKQLDDAKKAWAALDHARLDAMSDEDITAAAAADPDCYLPTDEELARFKLVHAPKRDRKHKHAAE